MMLEKELDQHLRAMTTGAGLKLIKSRKRKPGAGDYGRYGLKTANGQPCFGFDGDELTATAEEIASFLQKRAQGQWRQSVTSVAAQPRPKPKRKQQTIASPEPAPASGRTARKKAKPPPADILEPEPPPAPARNPEPPPEPKLRLREATDADAKAIAGLVKQMGLSTPEAAIRRQLRAANGRHEAVIIAELDAVVGCVSCHAIPALHLGRPIGRIALLVVDQAHRRQGIGTRLVQEAEARLSRDDCGSLEIVTDIAYSGALRFLLKCGYSERSYRLAKRLRA
jgi:GNAT superfamily N-acetyltransferase